MTNVRAGALRILVVAVVALVGGLGPAAASAAPTERVFELVTRYAVNGTEEGLNGVEPGYGTPAQDGEAVDWLGTGSCCGASSAAETFYQSYRTSAGWNTRALTPDPTRQLEGFVEEQVPVFWTLDLGETLFSTPVGYAAGDDRPVGSRADDLYLESPTGALTWVSQGTMGSGTEPVSAKFAGATPNAASIAFSTQEVLTPNATALASGSPAPEYLYLRNVSADTTELIDVNNEDKLLDPYGASLGNGTELTENDIPANYVGNTTNAVADEGRKVFFESPPSTEGGLAPYGPPHLYMRDLGSDTTTPLDDPADEGGARFEGATASGSLVIFTSDEGLDGAGDSDELYAFNSTTKPIGDVPPLGSVALGGGDGGFVGMTAMGTTADRVYFVSTRALPAVPTAAGETPRAGQPNLYMDDVESGALAYVATVGAPDVNDCDFTCTTGRPAGLAAPVDIDRPAYPTPTGDMLAFESTANLTNEARTPTTVLSAALKSRALTLHVVSGAGFAPGDVIAIGSGDEEEVAEVASVGPNELTVQETSSGGSTGVWNSHPVGANIRQLAAEVYVYSAATQTLRCISCADTGTAVTSAVIGGEGGGTYDPPGGSPPMSENGIRVFFDSAEALVPEAEAALAPDDDIMHAYEWDANGVRLLSPPDAAAVVEGTDRTGANVFIGSDATISPGGEASGLAGEYRLYDAREHGGFPEANHNEEECSGDLCHEASGETAQFEMVEPPSELLTSAAGSGHKSGWLHVHPISRSQLRHLFATGELAVHVTVSGSGPWSARLLGQHGGTLAAAKGETHDGVGRLRLHLRAGAIRAIRRGAIRYLRVLVSYSRARGVRAVTLTVPLAEQRNLGGHHG
jgi:hypothetical protein